MIPAFRIRTHELRAILLLAGLMGLCGCTTIQVGQGESRSILAIGIVRVKVAEPEMGVKIIERAGLGFGLDHLVGHSAFLGWSEGRWIMAKPDSCRTIIFIRNREQAQRIALMLDGLEGKSTCTINTPE